MAYEFEYNRRVEFYETDMAGIAHFSNFFRWMEAAEAAFFESLGTNLVEPLGEDAIRGWPRVRAHCEYHSPVRFGDTVTIHLLVKELKVRAIEYVFYLYTGSGAERTHVATGGMTTVCIQRGLKVNSQLQAFAIPLHLAAVLEVAPPQALKRKNA